MIWLNRPLFETGRSNHQVHRAGGAWPRNCPTARMAGVVSATFR